jgi:Sensors of blue-light using FAD
MYVVGQHSLRSEGWHMYSVVYVSSATVDFSSAQLVQLLDVSRRNNAVVGVTGMLLYKDGNFMQVLEGEQQAVQDVYTRVARDTRHAGVLRLLREEYSQRQFPNWSMGFRHADQVPAELAANFSDLLSSAFVAPVFAHDPQRAWRLLLGFRDTLR